MNWLVLLTVLGTSLGVCALLVLTQRWHGRLSLDHDLSGVQKIHEHPVPRVGGLAIATGLVVGVMVASWQGKAHAGQIQALLLCAIPAFGAGLLEDLTKRVSVRSRLVASFVSAGLAIWLLNACLVRLSTPILDDMMTIGPLAMVFTCFAVGGVTNAVNIIDGVNGLASGSVALMLGGLGVISLLQGDVFVMQLCLMGVAALVGFMVMNFPFGKIFLGDGGAYLAGFWLAECAVLLLARNPEVSTWAVLLACIYPVWETAFSMYRRHVVGRVNSGLPDIKHFHHLVLRQYSQYRLHAAAPVWLRHALTSTSIWMMVLPCQVVAASSATFTPLMILSTLLFGVLYQALYRGMLGADEESAESQETQDVTVEQA